MSRRYDAHGMYGTPTYSSWAAMKTRTTNPRSSRWGYYGGRGIKVCARWQSFAAFYEDMGDRPEGMTLDRIDVNGNYSCGKCEECVTHGWPMNCRWTDWNTQVRNRRKHAGASSRFIGVRKHHGGWRASLCVNYEQMNLGHFATEEEAARARDAEVVELGIDAPLNFPVKAAA